MKIRSKNRSVAYRAVFLAALMVLSTAVLGVGSVAATGSGTPTVDASAGVTTYTVGGAGVVVDPGIVVSDSAGGTYDGARVVIQNLQAGDQLAVTAQGGISGSYDGSSGVLTLSGSATAVEYQAVFRSVTYSSSVSSPDLSDRQISFSIGAILPNDDNGHFYEFVPADDITWTEARDDAASRTLYGLQGYLVTVTSAEENAFVASKLQGQGWLGASDAASEGTWEWVTGPEAGTHFSNQDQLGFCSANTIVSGVNGQYVNWQAGEPNDCGGEDYAHFRTNGEWNDYPGLVGPEHDIQGYVVEYGGMAGDPAATWSDTKTVVVDETPVVVTSAGETDYLLTDAAVVVDAAIVASDANDDSFDGARVVIQNPHSDDVLSFTPQHGITGSYDATAGVLTLSGTASAGQYQDAFRSVTFANANPTADVTDRRITFALGSTLPSDATGHFYEYVSAGGISWHDANAAASASSYLGLQGYLATVTSQAENDFIAQKLDGSGWIGASDDTAFSYISEDANGNDRWHWVTGPEAGTHFWTGYANGYVEPGQYANWQSGEPNDFFGADSENYAHFYASGVWNDFPGDQYVDGYVVEYGGFGGESEITWQDTKVVAVKANSPPTADANGPYSVDEGGSVQLDGSGSSDPEGGSLTYAWDLDNDGQYDDAAGFNPTFSAAGLDGLSSHTVGLRVTDDEGATDTTTATVEVSNVAPSIGVNVDSGNTVYYVDWTAADPAGGTASGVINLPNGDTVSLTFDALTPDGSHAAYFGAQTSGGTNFWIPDDPYISTEVPNAPPDSDILQLSGTNDVTYRVSLSEPIVDPIMAIVSLGAPTDPAVYDFDAPYTIVSQGIGYFGGTGTGLSQQPGDALRGYEAHGTIKFLGTYDTFSWTVPDNEVWHGFTFAIRTTSSLGNTDVQEGETATNSGTWTDPGPGGDGVVVTATGEDGNPLGTAVTNPDGTWEWSFDTSDGPSESQLVTVTATDKDGASNSETFDLTVNNVAPSVGADAASVTVDEGQVATNTGTVSDPGADTVTLTASAGTVQNNGDGTWSWSFATTDGTDDSQTVTITADDGDGGVTTTSFDLIVDNVAPSVSADSASVTVDEGQAAANTGTFADPGDDTVSVSASIGSVTQDAAGTWSWSAPTTDGPDDSQTVVVTATDSDNAATTTTFELIVENVAPSVSADSASVTVDEGQTATNAGSFSDPGDDVVTVTASVGTLNQNPDGTWSWSFDSTDGPDESQPVTITATDSDGGVSTTTFQLNVENVAPSVDADAASVTVDEGQTATNAGAFADPGDDVVTVSASVGTVTQAADGTWSWSFDAIDGPTDSQVVTVTATDSDGAATSTTFQLTVNNVAPTLSADVDDYGVAGSPVTASGTFADAGVADTHTVTVDWGDGTSSSASITQGAGSGSFDDSHAYATGGFYDVTVTVTDDNGGVDVYTESITVAHLATIDVKPDSSENPVNPKAKGVLPVAILNTGDFDLTQVDVSTLRLSATDGGAGAATAHDGHLEDVDDDGDLDLMLHFVNADIGLTGDTTAVYLSGFMTDDVPVVGSDMVDPVPVGDGDDDDDAGASGNGNGKGNGRGR